MRPISDYMYMHCSNFEIEGNRLDGGDVLVTIAALLTEGRIPGKPASKATGFHEGPHCALKKPSEEHVCNSNDPLCLKYEKVKEEVLDLWQKGIPLCVEVVLNSGCACNSGQTEGCSSKSPLEPSDFSDSGLLLEQWFINISHRRIQDKTQLNFQQLMNAVRSQLHFSQLSAWLSSNENDFKIIKNNITYRLTVPGETYEASHFTSSSIKHDFPVTDIGNGLCLQISLLSLPRLSQIPSVKCNKCEPVLSISFDKIQISKNQLKTFQKDLVDDRMYTSCTLKGKHRCEDFDDVDCGSKKDPKFGKFKRVCNYTDYAHCQPSTSNYSGNSFCASSSTDSNIEAKKSISKSPQKTGIESELNVNDKRYLNSNFKQKLKNPKLDFEESDDAKEGDLSKQQQQSKGDILLNAILRSCHSQSNNSNAQSNQVESNYVANGVCEKDNEKGKCDFKCVQRHGQERPCSCANAIKCESDNISICDNPSASGDIFSTKDKVKYNVYIDKHCDSPIPKIKYKKIRDISNVQHNHSNSSKYNKIRQKIIFHDDDDSDDKSNKRSPPPTDVAALFDDEVFNIVQEPFGDFIKSVGVEVPSAFEQAKFKKSLDNATSMVFHSRTGLPLTSSPAPIRRGKSCFDFDSSINSVSAIGNALFSLASDDESESDGSIISPCSPDSYLLPKKEALPSKYYRRRHPHNLLGTFEESVLNGRLEPVSTVHGFTAELGASGSFVPQHLVVPVTVFFYNLGDNDKVSSPYLGHINLGRKGYQVPKSGTVQVTLFNPLGTVVKMFVIMYDLSEMPPSTQTFIRQRTLYMPTNCSDKNLEWGPKWLRYLIHLRKIYFDDKSISTEESWAPDLLKNVWVTNRRKAFQKEDILLKNARKNYNGVNLGSLLKEEYCLIRWIRMKND
ncbi:hypothetical protein FQR65_LT05879 [Abscondita terminalis]|nr:hypothetical protein FQR65_LT05879 [Abscondita terminalis]